LELREYAKQFRKEVKQWTKITNAYIKASGTSAPAFAGYVKAMAAKHETKKPVFDFEAYREKLKSVPC